jgi:integrase
MSKAVYKLSKKVGFDGKAQVIIDLTITRTNRPCFKSGIFVKPSWFKNQEIVVPKSGKLNQLEVKSAQKAKSQLADLTVRMITICNQVVPRTEIKADHEYIVNALKAVENIPAEEITFENIEKGMSAKSVCKSMSFDDYADLYCSRKDITKSNKIKDECMFRALKRYVYYIQISKNKPKFDLDINAINKGTIQNIIDFMQNECQLTADYPDIFQKIFREHNVDEVGRQCRNVRGRNTMIKLEKVLKAFFNWLIKHEYTDNQPFKSIEIGTQKYGTPYFLTLEERNKIADFDIKKKYNSLTLKEQNKYKSGLDTMLTQRDIFIFQCLTACRVSDLVRLTINSIDKDHILNYIAVKTKKSRQNVISVPLNEQAQKLVEKYKDVDKKGRLFPFTDLQKYNYAIKDVCRLCDIDRLIDKLNPVTQNEEKMPLWRLASSHLARRTFAGNAYNKVQDPNIICSMTGHVEGSQAFSRYRTIDNDLKKKVIDLIS